MKKNEDFDPSARGGVPIEKIHFSVLEAVDFVWCWYTMYTTPTQLQELCTGHTQLGKVLIVSKHHQKLLVM